MILALVPVLDELIATKIAVLHQTIELNTYDTERPNGSR